MANVILLWSDSLPGIKLSKLFKKLPQRILKDFFKIIIIYFKNYYHDDALKPTQLYCIFEPPIASGIMVS